MSNTIAVLSQKGGTGKTTAVRTLADALRRSGVRTLAVDLDPQGNLSDYFDLPPDVEPTIADVLAGRAAASEAVHEEMIPANLSLAETELMLGGKMGRELTLRRALAALPDEYDLVLIDCPPSLGLLTINALVAADWALITAEAQYFALQGVEQAIEVVELARDSLNPKLALLGVLLNLADMRTVHSREALVSLKERFGDQVFETVIRASIAYAESAERARSILDHRPDLGADYVALADEILARMPGLTDARLLGHVRSLRLERHPQQLRPSLDLGPERFSDGARLLVEAPHEHGRAGAGDRRAERSKLSRAGGELERARIQVRAPALVQAVLQTACEQIPVAAREPEGKQGAVGDVEHRILHRHLRGQGGARGARADGPLGHHGEGLQPCRRVKSGGLAIRADDEPAAQRSGDVVRVTLELGGACQQVGVELEQVIGSHQAGDDRRAARTQAARQGNLGAYLEGEAVRRMQPLEGPNAEVLPALRDRQLRLDGEAPRLDDLQFQVQSQRGRHAVEAGTEVC
jgi:chromosome partitioning protein